ncbi:Gfo/Idh/MocA family protein [Bacillus suaedae]|uniref:Gfo/Idh/MocA family oxidoreductase n=1 Tax=Halalkalibacter suaedae TaxID=2822140 RepID=A0A941AQE5_9BACI|nr:Gfo/Idh/MocA family oxidoreductase [Bacillus suaedae]MBP3952706.1 Gfo/Idh/MocA family oxidoreductase [Bacillus suaedae]
MTLMIGIVGTGGFSKLHADLLDNMNDVMIKAICGTSAEKAGKLALNYKNAKGYDDFGQMIDNEKLDAVYICVPPFAHGEIEKKAVEAGIPFFVEKPLGVQLQEPLDILAKVKERDLITSVGYHFRYQPTIQYIKEQLQSKKIGMISGKWMGSMPKVGWWRKQAGSGGQFIEQTTHIVDLLRYVAGEVDEVYAAFANRVVHEQYDGVSVHDVGAVTLKFKNGCIASLINTCVLPGTNFEAGFSIYTDQGVYDWDLNRLEERINGKVKEQQHFLNPYQLESEAFIHAVRTGDRSKIRSSYEDAFKTFQVTYKALQSAEEGRPIEIE